jgi:hypothetical protein
MLMKDNIPRDNKLFSIKIKEFITFCAKRISYKDTWNNSGIKLGSMGA